MSDTGNNAQPPAEPGHESRDSLTPQELAVRGWKSRLARLVVALISIECLTGLWIYLAPFSVASQVQLLLHTAFGLALLFPYLIYQFLHWEVWRRQTMTATMFLGYALMAVTLTSIVSGIGVTWQGLVGPKLNTSWDMVHLVSGIAVFLLTTLHLLLAFLLRRRIATRLSPDYGPAVRGFSGRILGWLGFAAVIVISVSLIWPAQRANIPVPEGYTLPDYVDKYDEYRGSPFAPTYARTESGQLTDPNLLAHSASCGTAGCHEEILAEWEPSAHRFAAMNPPFQKVQKNFANDRHPADTRYCAGCHDPISLFAGAKDIHNLDLSAPGMNEGVSCVACHSISSADQRGNADYVLTPPTKYIWEDTGGGRKLLSDFLIRSYPRQHLADYDRNILRTPEFCGACHKQFIPEALNQYGLSPGQNQYDEWRKSHWHTQDPATDLSCRDCHMRLVPNSRDPGRGEAGDTRRTADDGTHRHHGTIAANLLMPAVLKLPHWEKQVRLTEEWLRGETVIPEIQHLWPHGPPATLEIVRPAEIRPGAETNLMVLLRNRKTGHNLTTGPLDFIRNWVHVRITDADDRIIGEWGAIDPETRRITDRAGSPHQIGNARDEGTLVLEGQPLDGEGKPLMEHELWRKAGGKGQRVVSPLYTDKQTYRFTVPPGTRGPLTAVADLNYRRYRQDFLDRVVPTMEADSGFYQPTITQHTVRETIPLASEPPDPSADARKEAAP